VSKRRGRDWPPPSGRGGVGPVIECYPDDLIAGEPLGKVYELDPATGMMKLMDPQPPHPFPEAHAAWLAKQAAKAQQTPETTPPAG
jgi:hypothetical protein